MGSHPVLRRHLFPPSLCSLPPASLCPGSCSPSSRPLVSVLPAFFPSFFSCSPFNTCRIYSVLGIAFISIHPSIHQLSISPSLHHPHGNLHPSLPVNQPINPSIPSTCLRIGQITRHCLQYTTVPTYSVRRRVSKSRHPNSFNPHRVLARQPATRSSQPIRFSRWRQATKHVFKQHTEGSFSRSAADLSTSAPTYQKNMTGDRTGL